MRFAYEDLSDHQFEELVVFLCRHLLGMGTQGFAKGVDGGRDAKSSEQRSYSQARLHRGAAR